MCYNGWFHIEKSFEITLFLSIVAWQVKRVDERKKTKRKNKKMKYDRPEPIGENETSVSRYKRIRFTKKMKNNEIWHIMRRIEGTNLPEKKNKTFVVETN